MKPPEIETAAPMGSIIGSGGNSKVITTQGTYFTFSLSAMDFAIASVASRSHLPAPTARAVVELACLGGRP